MTADDQKVHGRLRFENLVLDLDQRRLFVEGEAVALSKLNFRVLRSLAVAAPAVVTKDELGEQVWGGRFVTPETVAQRIKLLRQILKDDARAPRYIEVVRGQGYRLIPDVTAEKPVVEKRAGGNTNCEDSDKEIRDGLVRAEVILGVDR